MACHLLISITIKQKAWPRLLPLLVVVLMVVRVHQHIYGVILLFVATQPLQCRAQLRATYAVPRQQGVTLVPTIVVCLVFLFAVAGPPI